MKLGILGLVLISGLLVTGCSKPVNENGNASKPAASATSTPDEFARARINYAKHCEECHKVDGTGGLVEVDQKKLKVPNLAEGHALKHTDEDFVEQIEKGGDGMPQFKDKLSAEEINGLVRFVRHEFQQKP
jgi:mono/diheme cytochrome c family protein